ncbi:MAG: DUF1573 domain-containing protein [Saprospiraceae bacterium]
MKNILALLILCFSVVAVNAQDAAPAASVDGPDMNFETTEIDYGTIAQNSDPLRVFKFTNEGTEPLVIKHAKGSCGCTVPSYPKQPIAPGESATIEVRYDTKRIGPFQKTVTLTTNENDEKHTLRIKGKVEQAAASEDALPESAPSLLNGGGR